MSEVLCNILIEFCINMNQVSLIKMSLNETYSTVRVGQHLSDVFPIRNSLKQGDFSPLLSNFAVEYDVRRVQVTQDGLKLYGIHQLLVYAYYVNMLGRSVNTTRGADKSLARLGRKQATATKLRIYST